MSELLTEASRQAAQLRHRWLGPEHLVLALISGASPAGRALRACGVDYDAYRLAVADLPAHYASREPIPALATGEHALDAAARDVIARAEGLAVGLGTSSLRPCHVLLSLLWDQGTPVALHLLEKLGVSRTDLAVELSRQGVEMPRMPLPTPPEWGPSRTVTAEEFDRIAKDLRRRGERFRFTRSGDTVTFSVARNDAFITTV